MNLFRSLIVAFLAMGTVSGWAQTESAAVLSEHWNVGVIAGGGTGLMDRTDVQYIRTGVRVGRVMTSEIGSSALRGTFEVDSEITPVDYVLWNGYKNVYSFGITPVILKWNFTAGQKVYPYVLAQGGMLRNSDDVPPGRTSKINFVTGFGVGMQYFVKPRRSFNWDLRATHLSNASLGSHNPGVNASLQFSLGYNWWKK